MRTETDFLHAVCARPDDDTLWLVYADWLEDYSADTSDPDAARTRAEFIRVQVELARLQGDRGVRRARTDRPGHQAGTGYRADCDLAVRVEKLFGHLPRESICGGTGDGSWTLRFPNLRQWERGFPASVEQIDAEFWLARADDILARYPIRRVVLIDWPEPDVFDRGLRTFRFRGWRNHAFADWVDPSCTDRQFVRRMLVEEWPAIAFELPPGYGS